MSLSARGIRVLESAANDGDCGRENSVSVKTRAAIKIRFRVRFEIAAAFNVFIS